MADNVKILIHIYNFIKQRKLVIILLPLYRSYGFLNREYIQCFEEFNKTLRNTSRQKLVYMNICGRNVFLLIESFKIICMLTSKCLQEVVG